MKYHNFFACCKLSYLQLIDSLKTYALTVFVFPNLRPFVWPPASTSAPAPEFKFAGPDPQFVFTISGPQFAFTNPDPQFVSAGPGSQFVFAGPAISLIIF